MHILNPPLMACDNYSTWLILSIFQHLSYQSLRMEQLKYNRHNMVTNCQQFICN